MTTEASPIPAVNARDAQPEAHDGAVRALIAGGADPILGRRRAKLAAAFSASNSFGDIAKEYIEKMVADGRAETTTVKANWLLEQLKPISKMKRARYIMWSFHSPVRKFSPSMLASV